MPLAALRARLADVSDLAQAAAVLEWDAETFRPPGAAEARTHQVATLRRLAHERLTADDTAALLDAAEAALGTHAGPDDTDAALVRVARRDRDRAVLLPARLVTEKAEASGQAMEAWKAARAADDFAAFAPHLARIVDLSIEEADLVRPLVQAERGPAYAPTEADARYDALLDAYEPGGDTVQVAAIFETLREGLVPLVAAIAARPAPADVLHAPADEAAQWAFGLDVARAMGYDLDRGRLDRSAHPFTTSFATTDVRITTRVDPDFFPTAFFGTVHEVGHALYEQGIDAALDRTPLADGASLGMHESQSRLWENLVARSAPFWRFWYPALQARLPGAFGGVAEADFVRAVNRVQPSLIRVEADELTYHLHVGLRFEIERDLVAGRLAVADVPEAWNEAMRARLGIVPPSDADGCLQDVHWSLGAIGYFPTYTLGTLMSVQLWNAAARDLGDLGALVAGGGTAPLLGWLRTHVHRWGRALPAAEILRRATGEALDAGPWLAYAREKYGALYEV